MRIVINNILIKTGNIRGKIQCELNSALIYTQESGHIKGRIRHREGVRELSRVKEVKNNNKQEGSWPM